MGTHPDEPSVGVEALPPPCAGVHPTFSGMTRPQKTVRSKFGSRGVWKVEVESGPNRLPLVTHPPKSGSAGVGSRGVAWLGTGQSRISGKLPEGFHWPSPAQG